MGETNWTPGPWEVRAGEVFRVGSGGPPLVTMYGGTPGARDHSASAAEERLARAHLIAAAPDLYAALEGLVACISETRGVDATAALHDAAAALAKARGETP